MRSMLFLCLLGVMLGLALAAPHPKPAVDKRSFKVERVRNPNFTGRNSPKQLLKAHIKYGAKPSEALVEHVKRQEIAANQAAVAVAARAVAGTPFDLYSRRQGGKYRGGSGAATAASVASEIQAVAAAAVNKAGGAAKAGGAKAGKKGGKKGGNKGAGSASGAAAGAGAAGAGAATAGSSSSSSSSSSNTSSAAPAVSSDGTGSVVNTPQTNDVEYLSPVDIGGQTLNLDFDTGSSDLWVFNTQLDAADSTGHTLYDPTKSTTFAEIKGASFAVSYGDGSNVAGNVGTDTVNIGGATVTSQAVELATSVSASFVKDTDTDGLLGLAFSKLNTVKPAQQKTFFDNISGDLAEPVFTADLRHNANGAYEFGKIDTTKFTGDMTFVDVNTTQGFWQFSSASFAVDGGAVQQGGAGQAIADTGTTLMLVSADIVNAYYSTVNGAVDNQQVGGVTVPCDATLPDLQIDVGGSMATVKGSDILFEEVTPGTCFGGMQAIDSDLMIFGDIFFKSNFVAFNNGNNTLGFATHA